MTKTKEDKELLVLCSEDAAFEISTVIDPLSLVRIIPCRGSITLESIWDVVGERPVMHIQSGVSFSPTFSDLWKRLDLEPDKIHSFNDGSILLFVLNETNRERVRQGYDGMKEDIILEPINVLEYLEKLPTLSFRRDLEGKAFVWEGRVIHFLENGKLIAFGETDYHYIKKDIVKAFLREDLYYIRFNEDFSSFHALRSRDGEVLTGACKKNPIPPVFMQTDKKKPEPYVLEQIRYWCPGWTYRHFDDEECVAYLKNNPIFEFPFLTKKFKDIQIGAHKGDFFRYVFLYLEGGVFLDSDAMWEMPIHDVLLDYDSIWVEQLDQDSMIFNGLLAVPPRHPVIYKALYKMYHAPTTIYNKYSFAALADLYIVLQEEKTSLTGAAFFKEVRGCIMPLFETAYTVNVAGEKVMCHYFITKKIPKLGEVYPPKTKETWNSFLSKNMKGKLFQNHSDLRKYMTQLKAMYQKLDG